MKDKPPNNLKISFGRGNPKNKGFYTELKDPQDFVVFGTNSNNGNFMNSLKCEASNADKIYWEYKKPEGGEYNTTVPGVMKIGEPVSSENGDISLVIDDGDTVKLGKLCYSDFVWLILILIITTKIVFSPYYGVCYQSKGNLLWVNGVTKK